MRSIVLVMLIFVFLPRPAKADEAGEAAIRKIVAEQVTAWNAGDGAAYAKHLAPEAAFTNLFGMVMYGAPAFAKRHTEILGTFYKARRSTTRYGGFASSRPTSRSSTSTTKSAASRRCPPASSSRPTAW